MKRHRKPYPHEKAIYSLLQAWKQMVGNLAGRKQMRDKAFLDTNIIIYLYSEDDELKRSAACYVLDNYNCVTSIQVMNESCNVWFGKYKWSKV